MWNLVINVIGYLLLYAAVDYKRSSGTKIVFLSLDWVVIILMVTGGAIMSQYDN